MNNATERVIGARQLHWHNGQSTVNIYSTGY